MVYQDIVRVSWGYHGDMGCNGDMVRISWGYHGDMGCNGGYKRLDMMFGSAQKISPLHGKALSSNRQISGGIAVHDMGYPISNKTPYL